MNRLAILSLGCLFLNLGFAAEPPSKPDLPYSEPVAVAAE